MQNHISLVWFFIFLGFCESANILVIYPHFGKSHFLAFEYMFKTLAAKGHNLTVISFFPQKIPLPNYRDVPIDTEENITGLGVFSMGMFPQPRIVMYTGANFVYTLAEFSCPIFLSHPNLQSFLREDNKFDVVMVELFNTNCHLGIAKKFNAPIIGLSSSMPVPWFNPVFGAPDNPAYVPSILMGFNDNMTFFERVENTLTSILFKLTYEFLMRRRGIEYSQKYIGEDPEAVWDNLSLFFVNKHFTANRPRPTVPSIIDVSGIHIEESKPLPKDFERYITESESGVVFMSMGSMLKGTSFPKDIRENFLKAFSKLPQRIIWKWESETMEGKPRNVKLTKWAPQRDLLCHPNVKAFITHGGLLGSIEAIYCGVPVIIIPQFGDQFSNAAAMVANGNGIRMLLDEATEETISNNLKTVLTDRFQKEAKSLASRFSDRPLTPMDEAIFWTEYVIRHKGAKFMKTAAVNMPAYQYYLLDVILFILVVVSSILFVAYKTILFIFRLMFLRKTKIKTN